MLVRVLILFQALLQDFIGYFCNLDSIIFEKSLTEFHNEDPNLFNWFLVSGKKYIKRIKWLGKLKFIGSNNNFMLRQKLRLIGFIAISYVRRLFPCSEIISKQRERKIYWKMNNLNNNKEYIDWFNFWKHNRSKKIKATFSNLTKTIYQAQSKVIPQVKNLVIPKVKRQAKPQSSQCNHHNHQAGTANNLKL